MNELAIRISRVENGFVVSVLDDDGDVAKQLVASSDGNLADVVVALVNPDNAPESEPAKPKKSGAK